MGNLGELNFPAARCGADKGALGRIEGGVQFSLIKSDWQTQPAKPTKYFKSQNPKIVFAMYGKSTNWPWLSKAPSWGVSCLRIIRAAQRPRYLLEMPSCCRCPKRQRQFPVYPLPLARYYLDIF